MLLKKQSRDSPSSTSRVDFPLRSQQSLPMKSFLTQTNPDLSLTVCLFQSSTNTYWTNVEGPLTAHSIVDSPNSRSTRLFISQRSQRVVLVFLSWYLVTTFEARGQNCEKRLKFLPCLPVCPSTSINMAHTGQIFVKFYIRLFFDNLSRKFKFH